MYILTVHAHIQSVNFCQLSFVVPKAKNSTRLCVCVCVTVLMFVVWDYKQSLGLWHNGKYQQEDIVTFISSCCRAEYEEREREGRRDDDGVIDIVLEYRNYFMCKHSTLMHTNNLFINHNHLFINRNHLFINQNHLFIK